MKTTDVLIIGCGIAGATAALRLARNPQRQIVLITREPDPHESNSRYAQGGIIGRGPDDTADLLVKDILAAGAGASLPKAAEILAGEGPELLQEVLVQTARIDFDRIQTVIRNMGRKPPTAAGASCTWAMAPGRPSCRV